MLPKKQKPPERQPTGTPTASAKNDLQIEHINCIVDPGFFALIQDLLLWDAPTFVPSNLLSNKTTHIDFLILKTGIFNTVRSLFSKISLTFLCTVPMCKKRASTDFVVDPHSLQDLPCSHSQLLTQQRSALVPCAAIVEQCY